MLILILHDGNPWHFDSDPFRHENRCAMKIQMWAWLADMGVFVIYLLHFPPLSHRFPTGCTEMTFSISFLLLIHWCFAGRCPISTLPLLQTRRISDDHVRQLLLVKARWLVFQLEEQNTSNSNRPFRIYGIQKSQWKIYDTIPMGFFSPIPMTDVWDWYIYCTYMNGWFFWYTYI